MQIIELESSVASLSTENQKLNLKLIKEREHLKLKSSEVVLD
jgi:hypothetical protein